MRCSSSTVVACDQLAFTPSRDLMGDPVEPTDSNKIAHWWAIPVAVTGALAVLSFVLMSPDRHDWRTLHVDEGWVAASSTLRSLPFGDGWAGTDEVDRTLPPLQVWLSTALGGDLIGSRLASWTWASLTILATSLAASLGRLRPWTAGTIASLLLAFWPSSMAGQRWNAPWWEMASYGRYDMAGMFCVSILALTLAYSELRPTTKAAFIVGVAGGLSTCAHAMAIPLLVASGAVVASVGWRRAGAWILGVVVGLIPLLAWLISGGKASWQLWGQVSQRSVLLPEASSKWPRWWEIASDPGGLALMVVLMALLLPKATRSASCVALGSWAVLSIIDRGAGANYALLMLPFAAIGLARSVSEGTIWTRSLAAVTAFGLLSSGLGTVFQVAINREPIPPTPEEWLRRFSDDDRIFVDMKYLPITSNSASLVPYFVMRWALIPEDERTIGDRLSTWCPTKVVRARGQWPFHLVRSDAGGPDIQAWLDRAVVEWTPAPIPGFDPDVEIGIIDPSFCAQTLQP